MPKKPAPDALTPEAVGDLENYYDDQLQELRERILTDLARIDDEYRQADKRIKDFNVRKQQLMQERAERARVLRALKHELHQRMRVDGAAPTRNRAGRLLRPVR